MIVSKLQHPNIITLYDAGDQNGTPYLVYAYIEGRTLAQKLKEEKMLPFARAAEIALRYTTRVGLRTRARRIASGHQAGHIMIAKSGLAW